MTRTLAKDLGARGITVNTIAPGPTNTDLFREGKPEQLIQFFANMHPAKRIGEPDEIAPIVAFLSRDEAGWVNGQTIMINGVSPVELSENHIPEGGSSIREWLSRALRAPFHCPDSRTRTEDRALVL